MKSLPSAVTDQMNAQQSAPVLLFTLGFSTPLYYAASKANIIFPTGGQTYTAKAITFDRLQQSSTNNTYTLTVRFDNTSKDMASYAGTYEFQGTVLNIKRIYRDALGGATYYDELFNGTIETYEMNYYWCVISARSGVSLSSRCPSKIYQKKCPLTFGGSECNRDGNADITTSPLKITGTADSGTTTQLTDSILTAPAETYKYGILTCTKSGTTETRTVIEYGLHRLTVDAAFSFAIDNTTTYTVIAGCDKTFYTCGSFTTWGPTADNSLNYGGYPFVGKRPLTVYPGQAGNYAPVLGQEYTEADATNYADYYNSGIF